MGEPVRAPRHLTLVANVSGPRTGVSATPRGKPVTGRPPAAAAKQHAAAAGREAIIRNALASSPAERPTGGRTRAQLLHRMEVALEAMERVRGGCAIYCASEDMRVNDMRDIGEQMDIISACVRELAAL